MPHELTWPVPVRIFLSSPGDVNVERGIAEEVVSVLRGEIPFAGRAAIETVRWDRPGAPVSMPASLSPQEAVDQGLPRPSACDIVIVILWSRMGTPLSDESEKPEYFRFPTGTDWPASRYLSGTEYEYVDAMQAARLANTPIVKVYHRTKPVPPSPTATAEETKKAREQLAHVRAFFDSFTNADETFRRSEHNYAEPHEFRYMLHVHLRKDLACVLDRRRPGWQQLPPAVGSSPAWPAGLSPFPGLCAFAEKDAPIYFGRSNEVDALLRHLAESRFVAVVGASGSGKSSLVAAGLIPRLKRNAICDATVASVNWVIVPFRPGHAKGPFEAMRSALPADFQSGSSPEEFVRDLREAPGEVVGRFLGCLEQGPPSAELLLVIDQFEELYGAEVDDDARQDFLSMLDVVTRTKRLRVVATLRADFYHRCLESGLLAAMLRHGSFPLAAPDSTALEEMVNGPAAIAGLCIPPDLAKRIAEDVGRERGNLPLMAYTLDQLYKRAHGRPPTISSRDYEALGKVRGAIGTRAEEAFRELIEKECAHTAGTEGEWEEAVRRVFLGLTEINANGALTRRVAPMSEFDSDPRACRVIERFSESDVRLLVKAGGDSGGSGPGTVKGEAGKDGRETVEVAHEALLQEDTWPRLGKWISDNSPDWQLVAQLSQAANDWKTNGRRSYYLWHAERLRRVGRVLASWPVLKERLGDAERAFLDSREEARALLEELENLDISHHRRREIGERLSEIDDPRPGVGLRKDGWPDILWCPVPANERVEVCAGQVFAVETFFLARYEVTWGQFLAFADDPACLADDHWWGQSPRPSSLRKPRPDNYPANPANYPQPQVTWCEAMAFCRWLTDRLPADGWPPGAARTAGWVLRLPTEWEWQQAATGGEKGRLYPWGETWDGRQANTAESGLGAATAVGMYPGGRAPCGADDMVGGMQEWCLNDFGDVGNISEACTGNQQRALRGGHFSATSDLVSCFSRSGKPPQNARATRGFRLACVHAVAL